MLVAGLGAWLLWPGDGERPGAGAEPSGQADGSESTDEPPATPEDPSPPPTDEATEEPTEDPGTTDGGATAASMRSFVQDYFATVTSDPEASFEMLTPEFQAESGGFEGYSGFWSTIELGHAVRHPGRSRRAHDVVHHRLRHHLWADPHGAGHPAARAAG